MDSLNELRLYSLFCDFFFRIGDFWDLIIFDIFSTDLNKSHQDRDPRSLGKMKNVQNSNCTQ